MCLPLNCLKGVVKFNALITIIVGIISFLTGALINTQIGGSNKAFFKSAGEDSEIGLVASLYAFGIVAILVGLLGIYGGQKKNACLLAIYNLANLLFLVTFIALSIAAFFTADKFDKLSPDDCSNAPWSREVQLVATRADSTFCREGCVCQLNATKFPSGYFAGSGLLFDNDTSKQIYEYKSCPNYPITNKTEAADYDLMSAAENYFGCSGWCQPSKIYQFTDVNRGVPGSQTCFDNVTDWVHHYAALIGYVSLGISILLFLTVMMTFCLCCHPGKSSQKSYYQRMAYYDQ